MLHQNDLWLPGRVADVKTAIAAHPDAKIILTIENDQIRLSPIGYGISRARAWHREHATQHRNTGDFLSNRAADAAAAGDNADATGQEA